MREESIGERLRQARVAKGYSLEETASISDVPTHYLLAMEMDQFKLLPKDRINTYIEKYANAVDLDGVSLIHGYRNLASSKETAKVEITKKESSSEKAPLIVPRETAPVQVKPLTLQDRSQAETPSKTRRSRHKEEDDKKSYLPLLILILLSLAILAFVAYVTWKQLQQHQNQPVASEYVVTTSSASQSASEASTTSTPAESNPKPSLAVSGGQDNLAVTLQNPSPEIGVSLSLVEGAEEAWVAISGSETGEEGVLLTSENPTYQTNLPAGTSSSLITLGNSQSISVTIDGQPVDLSSLTSSLSYITLTVQS
ncbi:helix-turn-helix domain-containing protein [Streptococcus cuniculipharyngis]|uniref:Helix-turn-helix domain-containing protein n=1 Tax=Streptococcus cuniculipharyngis TaxID=1562651 RepID=A0A5C5SBE3_9STRE|nr:helix-turn-helix domain-containing protein [Streptococcus cuniculipharyngis]TWS97685.1 hypothetical protein FRX57_05205 [Streptococcus cuniculipharyngis]